MVYRENEEEKKKNTLSIEHVAEGLIYLLTYLLTYSMVQSPS